MTNYGSRTVCWVYDRRKKCQFTFILTDIQLVSTNILQIRIGFWKSENLLDQSRTGFDCFRQHRLRLRISKTADPHICSIHLLHSMAKFGSLCCFLSYISCSNNSLISRPGFSLGRIAGKSVTRGGAAVQQFFPWEFSRPPWKNVLDIVYNYAM